MPRICDNGERASALLSEAQKADDPIDAHGKEEAKGDGVGDGGRDFLQPFLHQGEEQSHEKGDERSPDQGEFETDIAVKVERIGSVIPKPNAERFVEKDARNKLGCRGNRRGQKEIQRASQDFIFASPEQQSARKRGADEKIDGEDGEAVNGAKGQGEKAAVAETLP